MLRLKSYLRKALFPLCVKYKPAYTCKTAEQALGPYTSIHHLKITPVRIHFTGYDNGLKEKLFETSITYTIPSSVALDSILEIAPVAVPGQESKLLRIVTRDLYAIYLTGTTGRMIRLKLSPDDIRYNLLFLFYWRLEHGVTSMINFVRQLLQSNVPIEE